MKQIVRAVTVVVWRSLHNARVPHRGIDMYQYDIRTGPFNSKEMKEFEESYGIKLLTHKIVCPTCKGTGRHVNPNIDADGLTREDFDSDPEFAEGYFNGVFDIPCNECGGENVVNAVDVEAMKQQDPQALQDWLDWLKSSYDTEAEYAAERRMGA